MLWRLRFVVCCWYYFVSLLEWLIMFSLWSVRWTCSAWQRWVRGRTTISCCTGWHCFLRGTRICYDPCFHSAFTLVGDIFDWVKDSVCISTGELCSKNSKSSKISKTKTYEDTCVNFPTFLLIAFPTMTGTTVTAQPVTDLICTGHICQCRCQLKVSEVLFMTQVNIDFSFHIGTKIFTVINDVFIGFKCLSWYQSC